jgi:L-aminopeptidase/D-esterase-like protein
MTTWTINQLERNTSDGFVTTVHYTVTKVDGDFSASTYGTISFEAGTPETPFESLTEAQVVAWVKDKLGEEVVEAALAANIEAQQNPVKASGLPWSN